MDRSSDLARIGIIAVLGLFAAFSYAGFAPPQQAIPTLLAQAAAPALIAADPFLASPGGFGASLLFPLARLTGLGAPPDWLGYPLHLAAALALLAGAVAVVRRRLTGGDLTAALLTVLIGAFFTTKLLAGISLAPLPASALTPHGLAQLFGLAALLAGLDRRPAPAALGACLALAFAPEATLPLALAAGLALAADAGLGRRRLWAAAPLLAGAATLLALAASAGPLPRPAAQPPLALALALAAAAWALRVAARETGSPLRPWLASLGAGMALAAALGLGAAALGLALPSPLDRIDLLALTAPAGWLILTVALARAATDAAAGGLERLLRLGAVMVLAPTPPAAAAALGLGLLARFLRLLREKLDWRPGAGLAPVAILPALLLALLVARSGTLSFAPGWADPVAFAETGRWSEGVFADAATWRAWRALAPLPDRPLVALYDNRAYHAADRARVAAPGRLVTHPAANLAAAKSPFLPPAGLLPADPALREEAARREAVILDLIHTLERGEPLSPLPVGRLAPAPGRPLVDIDQSIETFLTQRHMMILTSPGVARLFPPALPRRTVEGQVLIGFGLQP